MVTGTSREAARSGHGRRHRIALTLSVAVAGSLLLASTALAGTDVRRPAKPVSHGYSIPPPAVRIAATTATYQAIEAKFAARQSRPEAAASRLVPVNI